MGELAEVFAWTYTGLFVLLAIVVTIEWLRKRERGHGVLSLSIVSLTSAAVLGQLDGVLAPSAPDSNRVSLYVTAAYAGVVLSAYFLFLFRQNFAPSGRASRGVIGAGTVLVVLAVLVSGVVINDLNNPFTLVSEGLLVVLWFAAVGGSIARFWLASRGRAPVQRLRLRALSVAYSSILLFLVVSTAAQFLPLESPLGELIDTCLNLLIVLIAPLLWVAFSPPQWLRRFWRRQEVGLYRRGLEDLLLASTERSAVAAKAIDTAVRLVGAEQAALTDGSGTVLADRAMTVDLMTQLAAAHRDGADGVVRLGGPARLTAIVLPLKLAGGVGMLALVSGPASPFFGQDEVVLVRQFAIAVTAALERVQLIEALAEASHAKSEFLSRMSHELRTPLNAILGFTQLLEIDVLDTGQRDSVERIHRAGDNLLNLINEILDLTRIESGNIAVEVEPVGVSVVVEEALTLARPIGHMKQIAVRTDLGDRGLAVTADRQRILQVLLNLLSNAIKYSPAGSEVVVSAEEVAGHVRIHVVDRGQGIATESMDRVFQPFDRLGAEGTEVEGTGIGLTLSLALARLMGGDIGVSSTVGAGSDFWLSLPGAPSSAVEPTKPAPTAVPAIGGEGAILYIEDNASNVELVRRILERQQSHVRLDVAMLGGLGIDLARHRHYDLVLLDAHLPDLSGLEVLTQLRRGEETKGMPVVIVSADATQSRIEEAMANGAFRYLTKPINVKEFLGVVQEVLAA